MKKGFAIIGSNYGASLLELLAIIVIIAILTAIAFNWSVKSIGKARKNEAKMALKKIYEFELAYFQENGFYVYTTNDSLLDLPGWALPKGKPHYTFRVVKTSLGDSTYGFTVIATEIADADMNGIAQEQIFINQDGVFLGAR